MNRSQIVALLGLAAACGGQAMVEGNGQDTGGPVDAGNVADSGSVICDYFGGGNLKIDGAARMVQGVYYPAIDQPYTICSPSEKCVNAGGAGGQTVYVCCADDAAFCP